MLDQIWPFIGDYVKELLQTTVQDKIQQSHSSVAGFRFTQIDLGDIVSDLFCMRLGIFPSQVFNTIYPLMDLAMLPRSSKFPSVGTSWLQSYRVLHMTLDYH